MESDPRAQEHCGRTIDYDSWDSSAMVNIVADHRRGDRRCGICNGDNNVSGNNHPDSMRDWREEGPEISIYMQRQRHVLEKVVPTQLYYTWLE